MSDGTEQKDVDYSNLIRAQTRQVDIDAFKERGMKKVNVINAKKINELISQAVTNIIGRMEDADIETIKEDKAQIVMDSMAEFKRLFSEQKKEKEEQDRLQEELRLLRESMATEKNAAAAEISTVQMQQITDEIAELKAFMINQASKAQSQEMTRGAMMEQQADLLEDHFNELKAVLATGGNVAAQSAVADDKTQEALEKAVDRVTALLEEQEQSRNGTTMDALLKALTEFKNELGEKFDGLASAVKESVAAGTDHGAAALKDAISSLRDDLKNANTESLKAEISALREDLAEKTVAASTANTEALQAQLAKMEEMIEKGGGGGGGGQFSGDLSEIVNKLEGSMSRKLAEAGIGKVEVSADDAVAASGVMLGAAFKGMDDIESNIGALDARKTVDKAGGKKAKGALDALKKFKKGG
jgi:hypothetical protein